MAMWLTPGRLANIAHGSTGGLVFPAIFAPSLPPAARRASHGSRLLSRYDAPVTESWPHLDVRESRFTQHLRYLLPGILFALCPSEHDHAERRDGEWSRLLIVIEHLMNENLASRLQTLETLPRKEATLLRCPVMIDH